MIKFEGDNAIELHALLYALRPGIYTDDEIQGIYFDYYCSPQLFSQDNNTSCMFFMDSLTRRQLWHYIYNFPFGTIRDLSFYLNCKYPRLAWPLRLPLSLIMIYEGFPKSEITPFYERWLIKLTSKFENVEPPDNLWKAHSNDFDIRTWYYSNKTKNDKVIQWRRYSMSAKLLNILRVSRLQMKRTASALDFLFTYFYDSKTRGFIKSNIGVGYFRSSLHFSIWIYREKNDNDELVQASIGRTYSSLINGKNA